MSEVPIFASLLSVWGGRRVVECVRTPPPPPKSSRRGSRHCEKKILPGGGPSRRRLQYRKPHEGLRVRHTARRALRRGLPTPSVESRGARSATTRGSLGARSRGIPRGRRTAAVRSAPRHTGQGRRCAFSAPAPIPLGSAAPPAPVPRRDAPAHPRARRRARRDDPGGCDDLVYCFSDTSCLSPV